MRERLYRSRKEKMVAGVASGLAEYFEIDPVIVRIIFIAATFLTGGLGLIVYILLWLVVPYRDQVNAPVTEPPISEPGTGQTETTTAESYETRPEKKGHMAGYILIALGCLFLADRFIPHFDAEEFWPLIIIAIGVGLLLKGAKNNK